MSCTPKRLEAILESLRVELHWGVLCLQITKALQATYEDKGVPAAEHFFEGAYYACLRESLLCFSRLTEPSGLGIHCLLNCAQNMPKKAFAFAKPGDIQRSVDRHRQRVAALRPLVDCVKEQRDKVLAHLDRNHINKPKHLHPEITLSKVERSLDEFLEIVNKYKEYYDGTEYSLDDVRLGAADDIAYLARLIRNADV